MSPIDLPFSHGHKYQVKEPFQSAPITATVPLSIRQDNNFEDKLTKIPSRISSIYNSYLLDSHGAFSECQDDASYQGPFGLSCNKLVGLSCKLMGLLGVTELKTIELTILCLVSCQSCSKSD